MERWAGPSPLHTAEPFFVPSPWNAALAIASSHCEGDKKWF